MKRALLAVAHGAESARFEPVHRQDEISPIDEAADPGGEIDLDIAVLAVQAGTAMHHHDGSVGCGAAGPVQNAADLGPLRIAAGEMDLKPGGQYEYIFDHDQISEDAEPVPEKYAEECYPGMTMTGHVIAVDPPHMLHMTWAEGSDENSEVKFELEQVGDKVKLTLTHSKLFNQDLLLGVCAGWHAHVDIMADNLEGVPARQFWSNHMRLEEEYKKTLFESA